jgi:hypothetical protein
MAQDSHMIPSHIVRNVIRRSIPTDGMSTILCKAVLDHTCAASHGKLQCTLYELAST